MLKEVKEKRKELKNDLRTLRSVMKRKEEELKRLEYEYMKVNNAINEYSRVLRKDKNESFF